MKILITPKNNKLRDDLKEYAAPEVSPDQYLMEMLESRGQEIFVHSRNFMGWLDNEDCLWDFYIDPKDEAAELLSNLTKGIP